ncbi:MAG TPA: DUF2267 domain-containing protein [Euzebyales bacterium]|nr:DUF2267 domain-containing protein [Euzebyales bacterium]
MQTANSWIHDIAQRLDVDPDKATTVLGRCLGVIRDSLTVDEAADLAAQVPIVIRGLYHQEWKPSRTPVQRSRTDDALQELAQQRPFSAEVDPETAMAAVGAVLGSRVTRGQIADVNSQAPSWVARFVQPASR